MQILALDGKFNPLKYIPYINLQMWRRYYDFSEISVQIAASEYSTDIEYFFIEDRPETFIAQKVEYDRKNTGEYVQISGYSLEYILCDKIIYPVYNGYGNIETIARQLVTQYKDDIPNLILGALNGTLGSTIRLQESDAELGRKLYELLETQELSYRCEYDDETGKISFIVWKGLDRTQTQTDNNFVTFSDGFRNIGNVKATIDSSNFKNYAQIVANGDADENQIAYEVNMSGDVENHVEITEIVGNTVMSDGISSIDVVQNVGDSGNVTFTNTSESGISSNLNIPSQILRSLPDGTSDRIVKDGSKFYIENNVVNIEITIDGDGEGVSGNPRIIMDGTTEIESQYYDYDGMFYTADRFYRMDQYGQINETNVEYEYLNGFRQLFINFPDESGEIRSLITQKYLVNGTVKSNYGIYMDPYVYSFKDVAIIENIGNHKCMFLNAPIWYMSYSYSNIDQYGNKKYYAGFNLLVDSNNIITDPTFNVTGFDILKKMSVVPFEFNIKRDEIIRNEYTDSYYFTGLTIYNGLNTVSCPARFTINANGVEKSGTVCTFKSAYNYTKRLFVDARNMKYDADTQTVDEFKESLYQKGIEALSEYNVIQSIEFDADASNYTYLSDFDVGDKCDIILDRMQISWQARIIEIYEVFKQNQHTITLTFGDKIPTVYQKARMI